MTAAGLKLSELRVLFVSPECAPLTKAGGLGDVSAALPAALRKTGIDVRVLLPGYPGVLAAADDAKEAARLSLFDPPLEARLTEAQLPSGVPLIVLDCPRLYVRRGGPYQNESGADWADNGLRFGLLSKVAALLGSAATPLDWRPHVVHCNDWPAALTAAYLHYTPEPHSAALMTIHNLAFQGNFAPEMVAMLGLPPSSFAVEGLEFHGRMSFVKAGLFYADAITTVSPTYAREIQSEALGSGMQGLLQVRRASLSGILNGIDTETWNPETDPFIPRHYNSGTLELKASNKQALQRRFKLPVDPEIPLLGVVSRLTHQKGSDLLAAAATGLAALPAQLVALGTGERAHEDALVALAARTPGAVAVIIGFDEKLAHLIEAGADMFLMPSRFEPCGLNQMYSQRYGTPPIAHATGGLIDTIVDCTPATLANGSASGFLFDQPTAEALVDAVRRAIPVFRDRAKWQRLRQNGMAKDFTWKAAAQRYAELYLQLGNSVRGSRSSARS